VKRRPEGDRATTALTAAEDRREGTTCGQGMSSLVVSLPVRKGVATDCERRYTGGIEAEPCVSFGLAALTGSVSNANSPVSISNSRSVIEPAGGSEQRREAPADRSGAERGLAPRPRSRPVRGTGGTANERRGGRGAVAVRFRGGSLS
jgi:hypothetical protein